MTELERFQEFLNREPTKKNMVEDLLKQGESGVDQVATFACSMGFAVTVEDLEAEAVRVATNDMRSPQVPAPETSKNTKVRVATDGLFSPPGGGKGDGPDIFDLLGPIFHRLFNFFRGKP